MLDLFFVQIFEELVQFDALDAERLTSLLWFDVDRVQKGKERVLPSLAVFALVMAGRAHCAIEGHFVDSGAPGYVIVVVNA